MQSAPTGDDVTLIKKYANRRLYDTRSSEFVTLADLADMVKAGRQFVVEDSTSGADLTSSVLIQIIAEEEAKGEHLLPVDYLRQLIGFYGEDVGQYLTTYLEQTLQAFTANQQQFIDQMQAMFTAETPLQTVARQNMSLFKSTMESLANLGGFGRGATSRGHSDAARQAQPERQPEPREQPDERSQEIAELRGALAKLQKQMDEFSKGRG